MCFAQAPPVYESYSGEHMATPERKHKLNLADFGARGDNYTDDTFSLRSALDAARKVADDGGVTLVIPAGTYVTGPFNLTSHLTLELQSGATIIAKSMSVAFMEGDWPRVAPFPSYGIGRDRPAAERYTGFIGGYNITDVVISGAGNDVSAIDGFGWEWWDAHRAKTDTVTRPRLVEFLWSDGILLQDVQFVNSPFWTLHFVYSSNIIARRIQSLAPSDAPNTDGFDPDSAVNVTLVDSNLVTGDDGVAIKSGWDCAGIAYGRPTANVFIRNVTAYARKAGSISIGSEMSGGVQNVMVENCTLFGGGDGLHIKTSDKRGGYVRDIFFNNIIITGADKLALRVAETYGSANPFCGDQWNPPALSEVDNIVFTNIFIQDHPDTPFQFIGLEGRNATRIRLENVTTADGKGDSECKYVTGSTRNVRPAMCADLTPET